ncbi:hypothetical protein PQX77_014587 [Marasmius sp. AFHP31]|nr:hypothetical protein PQX77_014587 [Marasmius sp. AFHP31]
MISYPARAFSRDTLCYNDGIRGNGDPGLLLFKDTFIVYATQGTSATPDSCVHWPSFSFSLEYYEDFTSLFQQAFERQTWITPTFAVLGASRLYMQESLKSAEANDKERGIAIFLDCRGVCGVSHNLVLGGYGEVYETLEEIPQEE